MASKAKTAVPASAAIAVPELTARQGKSEHARLSAAIAEHDARYHRDDAPVISDAEFDELRRRFDALEARFPALAGSTPVSDSVGAAPSEKFSKRRHRVAMLSLGKAYTDDEVAEFVARVRRFLKLAEDAPLAFTAEPKIDGLSLSLRYEDGALVSATTRGDGQEGGGRHPERPHGGGHPGPPRRRGRPGGVRGARRDLPHAC